MTNLSLNATFICHQKQAWTIPLTGGSLWSKQIQNKTKVRSLLNVASEVHFVLHIFSTHLYSQSLDTRTIGKPPKRLSAPWTAAFSRLVQQNHLINVGERLCRVHGERVKNKFNDIPKHCKVFQSEVEAFLRLHLTFLHALCILDVFNWLHVSFSQ